MNTEENPSRNPSDWVYCNVAADRENILRAEIPFQEIISKILKGSVSTQKPPFLESNLDPLLGVVTNDVFPAGTCKRVVIYLVIDREFHDVFVNGISGLFAKYFQSAEVGRDATGAVISAVKECDAIFESAVGSDETIKQLWQKSLDGKYGIVWFDEDEFPREKYKRGSLMMIGPARPQIKNGYWRPRPVFRAGTRIVIKGAWIGPRDEIAILDSKKDNDEILFRNGFA